ncbi:MAG: peroxiredoxin [Sphingomonadales bacterium]|jgi:peroxiredoxin
MIACQKGQMIIIRTLRPLFLALAAMALPAAAALPEGRPAPAFATQAVIAGTPFAFRLQDALAKGPVVLYFFPGAYTSGCTLEAHAFSEATAQFAALGATVIGLSHDPIDKLARFSVSDCRNKFAVGIASPQIMADYKVKLPVVSMTNRTSYVIAPDGTILLSYTALSPNQHVPRALAAVKAWKDAQRPAR